MPGPEQAPGISSWDLDTPRRPTLADFNGAALQDDPDNPPDWTEMPTSNLLNGEACTLVGLAQVADSLVVSVVLSGGNPAIDSGATATGVSPGKSSPMLTGAVAVARSTVGTGQFVVYWPPGTFPAPTCRPKASLNGSTLGLIAADWYTGAIAGGATVSGVLISTSDPSGAAEDLPFTVEIP